MNSIDNKCEEIVDEVVRQLAISFGSQLISILLMGSILGKRKRDLQDVDFIIIVEDDVAPEIYFQIGRLIEKIARSFNNSNLQVLWISQDGPWHIPPSGCPTIGLHINIQGLSQHYRRLNHQPILAVSMFTNCKVLFGKHPLEIFLSSPPMIQTSITYQYGIPWLLTLLFTVVCDKTLSFESSLGLVRYCCISAIRNFVIVTKNKLPETDTAFIITFSELFPDGSVTNRLKNLYYGDYSTEGTDQEAIGSIIQEAIFCLNCISKEMEFRDVI